MSRSALRFNQLLFGLLVWGMVALTHAAAIDVDKKAIQIALTAEPPDLNSMRSTDQVSFFVIEHLMEGLLAYDKDGQLIPGIAKSWAFDEKGARFFLRENALWSDGVAVTAHDFVFAWRTVVNPETASRYSFILSPIKNAERITAGKLPPETLGVKAINDYELYVEFERPCAYFLNLTTFVSYLPVREDIYSRFKNKYFSDVEYMVFNGPYVLKQWVHGASLLMEKNPRFWNAEAIQINTIKVPYISADPNVIFNLFRNDEIISSGLDTDTIKLALQEHMQIKKFNVGALFYLELNHREERITSNKHFRKALQHAIDNEELVYKVIALPGNKVANSLFPSWLQGEQEKFLQENPPPVHSIDIELAQSFLEKAKQELKLKKFPPLVLLSSDSPVANKEAEYLQSVFKDKLGLDIRIDKQIFKQRLAKMSEGQFDMVLAGWGPDYNDPSTFGDLFYSKNNNNHGKYHNPHYDYWVEQAMNHTDTKIRMHAFAQMQRILHEDAVVLPKFERGVVYVEHPQIKNVARRIFGGDPSFRYAYLTEE